MFEFALMYNPQSTPSMMIAHRGMATIEALCYFPIGIEYNNL